MFRIFLSFDYQDDDSSVVDLRSKKIRLSSEQFVLELSNRYFDSEMILINSNKSLSIISFLGNEIGLSLAAFHRYETFASLERGDILYRVIVPSSMKIEDFEFLKFIYQGGFLKMV